MISANKNKVRSLIFGSLLLLIVIYVLSSQPRMKQFQGETMGTSYHVAYVSSLFANPVDIVSHKVYESLHDVDLRMSTYRDDSELMQFNRSPLNKPFKLSKDIVYLINQSQQISILSHGAYDVTVGPLVNLWGFGPRDYDQQGQPVIDATSDNIKTNSSKFTRYMLESIPSKVPSEASIKKALEYVGYQYVLPDITNSTLTRKKEVFIDLSSIAKGYGVDKVAEVLKEAGINDFMIEVGGEIFVKGSKPDGHKWQLAIRGPNIGEEQPVAIVKLSDKALATSGDYLNFFEVDGNRYSHSINPITGYPEKSRLAEVAVISNTVAEADALATMFMILGDEKGLELANRESIAAHFTYHDSRGTKSVFSQAFKPYLINLQ